MRCQPLNLAVVTVVGMPCLKLFGRRWGLANDDVIFAAVPLVVHLVWIITLPVLLSDAKSSESCDKRQYRVAISILFGLTVLAAVEECGIAIVALRGSMFDSHKRRWSHPLLYARSASIIAETAALIYATIIIEQPRQSCRNSSAGSTWHVPISARVFIWTSWAVLGIAYIVTIFSYKFWPDLDSEKSWKRRLRILSWLTCSRARVSALPEQDADSNEQQATPLARLAVVASSMFGYVDMTVSDFLAAFLLAAQLQRCRRRIALRHLASRKEDEETCVSCMSALDTASDGCASCIRSGKAIGSYAEATASNFLPNNTSCPTVSDSVHALPAVDGRASVSPSMQRRSHHRMTTDGISGPEEGDIQLQRVRWPRSHTHSRPQEVPNPSGDAHPPMPHNITQPQSNRSSTRPSGSARRHTHLGAHMEDRPNDGATSAVRRNSHHDVRTSGGQGSGISHPDAMSSGVLHMCRSLTRRAADRWKGQDRAMEPATGSEMVRLAAIGRQLLRHAAEVAPQSLGACGGLITSDPGGGSEEAYAARQGGDDRPTDLASLSNRTGGDAIEQHSTPRRSSSLGHKADSSKANAADTTGGFKEQAPPSASCRLDRFPPIPSRASPHNHQQPTGENTPRPSLGVPIEESRQPRSATERRQQRQFRTISLAEQPSTSLRDDVEGGADPATGTANPSTDTGFGLLTPSSMAHGLKPEMSARDNLELFGGAREAVSADDIAESAYYAKYSFAAYGYLLYVFSKPIYAGIFQLCCGRWLGLMRTLLFSKSTWRMRNVFPLAASKQIPNALNREAIQQITGLEEEDIVFIRFQGEGTPGCLPYFISLDHQKKAVVVAIRGTLSIADAITDALCDSARLDTWIREVPSGATPDTFNAQQPPKQQAGVDAKFAAHAGTLDAAKAIVQDCQATGILRALFRYDPATDVAASVPEGPAATESEQSEQLGAEAEEASDRSGSMAGATNGSALVRAVSHIASFGSVVTENTGWLVKTVKDQASTVVPAIQSIVAPLPSLDSQELKRIEELDCREWKLVVTGHSLGAGAAALVALYIHNYFPRVKAWCYEPPGGLMTRAASRALQPICTSTALGKDIVPRLSVSSFERMRDDMMMAAVRCKCSKWPFIIATLLGRRWEEGALFRSAEEVPESAAAVLAQYRENIMRERSLDTRRNLSLARQFVLPGRVMFMRPIKKFRKSIKKSFEVQYEAVWITCDDLAQEGILVSSRMMAEHMPDRVLRILQRLAQAKTGDPQGPMMAQPDNDLAMDANSDSDSDNGRSSGAATSSFRSVSAAHIYAASDPEMGLEPVLRTGNTQQTSTRGTPHGDKFGQSSPCISTHPGVHPPPVVDSVTASSVGVSTSGSCDAKDESKQSTGGMSNHLSGTGGDLGGMSDSDRRQHLIRMSRLDDLDLSDSDED